MALIQPGRWTVTSVIDVRLAQAPPGPGPGQPPSARLELGRPEPGPGQPPGAIGLPARLTLHIGAARAVAGVRMLGGQFARLTLDHPLPLHIGDRVLLRDPGAAADHAGGRPVFGATVLDVSPPRLRGRGAAAAAARELAAWPPQPSAADLLRRHRLLKAGPAAAMGLNDLPPPVTGDWLADPGHWQQLRELLAAAVAAHQARDPLARGLPVEAARAELGLPGRDLVEALAAWPAAGGAGPPIEADGGYLRTVGRGEGGRPGDTGRCRAGAAARWGGRSACAAAAPVRRRHRAASRSAPSGPGSQRGPGGARRPGGRAVPRSECRAAAGTGDRHEGGRGSGARWPAAPAARQHIAGTRRPGARGANPGGTATAVHHVSGATGTGHEPAGGDPAAGMAGPGGSHPAAGRRSPHDA